MHKHNYYSLHTYGSYVIVITAAFFNQSMKHREKQYLSNSSFSMKTATTIMCVYGQAHDMHCISYMYSYYKCYYNWGGAPPKSVHAQLAVRHPYFTWNEGLHTRTPKKAWHTYAVAGAHAPGVPAVPTPMAIIKHEGS